ncbi:MAG: ABC transporter permease subunit [Armatimonadetes bacterium]|nr:ABC transporter permease subunit [Armatimonadota bacterium]
MRAILTLAGLTLKEAARRRVFLAAALVAGLFVVFAFLPMPIRTGPLVGLTMDEARDTTGKVFAWMGCGTIKFFASVLAVTLAAGSITAEVERGVLSTIVPKPLARWQIYLGKWLGLLTLLAVSVAVWGGLLAWGIWRQTGTFHPRLFCGVLAAALFPLLFTTLTLFFSSFATSALSAGLALIAAGVALAEDTLLLLSRPFFLDSPTLATLSRVVGCIVPLGRMNHWITRGLDGAGRDVTAFPLFNPNGPGEAAVATTQGDMVYILVYIAAFLALGLVIFQRRDL